MDRLTLSRTIGAWIIGMILSLSQVAFAQANNPYELMQIHANRAVSNFVLYRGEGMQKSHVALLERDLSALTGAYQAARDPKPELHTALTELTQQLRLGLTFGPTEDDVPWRYVGELSQSLRDFLALANEQANSTAQSVIPVHIEYLSMQYMFRAFLGNFEIARDRTDLYLGQDERQLIPTLDAAIASLDESQPGIIRLKTRWNYLRTALVDMNSQSNALESMSGRPFAPLTVARHSRSLTDSWLALASQ